MMSLEFQTCRAHISYKDNKNRIIEKNCEEYNPSRDSPSIVSNSTNSNNNRSITLKIDNCESDLYHKAVYEILQTINDLEHSLIVDHQQDYKLRMALDRQKENIYDLRTSLVNEKERNQRLINLLENVSTASNMDDEYYDDERNDKFSNLNSINKAYGSISPLLMQQRYEELSISYKQCRHQLIKKEKQLSLCNCEKEMLQTKYDHLMDNYLVAQKRFENLCSRFLHLQKRKNLEIQQLRETLTHASDCMVGAQYIADNCRGRYTNECTIKEFDQNLQLFIKSLQFCDWSHCYCNNLSNESK